MAIKKKDFVEVEYTGKLKDNGMVFDTTDEKTAQENGIHNPQASYGPAIVCVGEEYLVKGLDKDIEGKDTGEFTVELNPEDAFGKKDAKLVQLIPTNKFRKENITPMPGMQVNIDNHMGVIKTVSGGRTLVDFNHPLSGQEVVYSYKIKRIVEEPKEKIMAVLKMFMGGQEPKLDEKEGKFTLVLEQELPEELTKALTDKIKELTDIELNVSVKAAKEADKTEPE